MCSKSLDLARFFCITFMISQAIFLMGPTASGKTSTAIALAERLPVEIISVDSALVYRDMNIGTAKPSAAELAQHPQHLIDIISPEQSYSAAQFCEDASRLITEISGRGKIPVLVGGTMMYFKVLHDGLSALPSADPALRAEIERVAATQGWPALHAQLATLDPDAAARLNPNDAQRIQRALEIVQITGRPLAESYQQKEETADFSSCLKIALEPSDRSVLHATIEQRLDQMLAGGFEEEVRSLMARYKLEPNMASMRCVGYRQMWEYLQGEVDWAEMRFKAIAATRQLAKRQITWLRQFKQQWSNLALVDSLNSAHQDQIHDLVAQWMANQSPA